MMDYKKYTYNLYLYSISVMKRVAIMGMTCKINFFNLSLDTDALFTRHLYAAELEMALNHNLLT